TARNRAIPTTRFPRRRRGPFRSVCRARGCYGCALLPSSKHQCSHTSEEARPRCSAIACAHANDGWEPETHGHGAEDTAQEIEGVEQATPVPHRAGRDQRPSERGEGSTETEGGW